MSQPLEKTRYPGIYRRGGRVVFTFRDRHGKQRWGSARTVEEARAEKARRHRARADDPRTTFLGYLQAWVEGYGHVRPETRAEYQADVGQWVGRFFSPTLRLADVDPALLAEFVGWLMRQRGTRIPRGASEAPLLSDSRIRNILNPVRAGLRDAAAQGLIGHNPAQGLRLPSRPRLEVEDEDEGPSSKALDPDELAAFLALVPAPWRLHFRFLACTGLRASEFLGLEVRHLKLTGDAPRVLVRQRVRGSTVGPLKSRHARRDLRLPDELVGELRSYTRGRATRERLWRTPSGAVCQRDNVRNRIIVPTAGEVGLSEVGWHTFRHTCASLLFARGDNLLAVSRFLGHHSPSFTLDTYVHLFERDECAPLVLPSMDVGRLPSVALPVTP